MPKFYGAIDLVKNELQNAVIQNLGSAPSSPTKGQMYFNSTDNTLYWYNGSTWIPAMDIGGGGAPTGPAGGDLGGAYPNPTVIKASTPSGFSVSGGKLVVNSGVDGSTGGLQLGGATGVAVNLFHSALGTISIDGGVKLIGSQGLDTSGYRINNVGDPTAGMDAANKQYVDNAINGLYWKSPVIAATTANIVLSGPQTIDGVAIVAGQRVLVKNQTDQTQNGVYLCAAGAWPRATDMDSGNELIQAAVFVESGTTQHDTAWTQTTDPPLTINTSNLVWTQFSGTTAPSYIGGGGLTLTGQTFDVGAGSGIIVNPDSVAIDPGTVMTWNQFIPYGYTTKKVFALAGTASPEVVTHNTGTRDVTLAVINGASPYNAVEVDWEATTTNIITIHYNPLLGAGYRAVVIA